MKVFKEGQVVYLPFNEENQCRIFEGIIEFTEGVLEEDELQQMITVQYNGKFSRILNTTVIVHNVEENGVLHTSFDTVWEQCLRQGKPIYFHCLGGSETLLKQ